MAEAESVIAPLEKKKRARSKNYSSQELECLVLQVEKNNEILVNKFSDTVTNSKKQKIWENIARAVSAVSSVDRSSEDVRVRYTKMKSEVKKKAGIDIRERKKTGGGSAASQSYSSVELKVLDLIGETAVQGVKGGLDTDTFQDTTDCSQMMENDILQQAVLSAAVCTLPEECDTVSVETENIAPTNVTLEGEDAHKELNWSKKMQKRSLTDELLEIEKEKLDLKKRKVDVMEKILETLNANTAALADIRDFLYKNKESMFMPINICDSEQ